MRPETMAITLALSLALANCRSTGAPTQTGAGQSSPDDSGFGAYPTDFEAIDRFRQVADLPDLALEATGTELMANSPHGGLTVTVYGDEQGRRYLIDSEGHTVVEFDGRAAMGLAEGTDTALSDSQLSDKALRMARAGVPDFDLLSHNLNYTAHVKEGHYFFDWRYAASPEYLMPPFVLVGMSASGEVFSYINTVTLREADTLTTTSVR